MKQTKLILLMMTACLAGCSSDDAEPKQTAEQKMSSQPSRPMIVEVQENAVVDAKTSAPMSITRAESPTNTTMLEKFSMNYLSTYKYDFTKTAGHWDTDKSWPSGVGNDQKIDFYAYTGGTFEFNSGTDPYVSFTVNEHASSQCDLLTAEHKAISYNDAGGRVSLLFDHACAIIQFNVYLSSALSTQLGGSLSVTSIVLRNVYSQGQYHYSSKEWTNAGTPRPYTLSNTEITVTTASQPLSCGYVFMIPQQREKNGTENVYLEINYDHGGAKTATIPMAVNWSAGKLYTLNINIGTAVISI